MASFSPGNTLRHLALWLSDRYAIDLPDRQTMLILNGKGWTQLPDNLDTPLHDGDVVLLAPVLMGG